MVEKMTLGQILRHKYADYEYTSLRDMAASLGVGYGHFTTLLNDGIYYPRASTRRAICRVLDIDQRVLDAAVIRGVKRGEGK